MVNSSGSSDVGSVLSLDVGSVRIGVALARLDVRLAHPLVTIAQDEQALNHIVALTQQHATRQIVVGWPRGLDGQITQQTLASEAFADRVRQATGLPVALQDEALTSHKAQTELETRGKPFVKADIDALAATYILEDYLGV